MEKETIIYKVDNFYDLKSASWSGALQILDKVEELGAEEQFLQLLNDVIGQGMEETALNDYIWFEADRDLKNYYNIDLWEEGEE